MSGDKGDKLELKSPLTSPVNSLRSLNSHDHATQIISLAIIIYNNIYIYLYKHISI